MITKGPQLDKKRLVFTEYQTILLSVHLIKSQKMRDKNWRIRLWEGWDNTENCLSRRRMWGRHMISGISFEEGTFRNICLIALILKTFVKQAQLWVVSNVPTLFSFYALIWGHDPLDVNLSNGGHLWLQRRSSSHIPFPFPPSLFLLFHL